MATVWGCTHRGGGVLVLDDHVAQLHDSSSGSLPSQTLHWWKWSVFADQAHHCEGHRYLLVRMFPHVGHRNAVQVFNCSGCMLLWANMAMGASYSAPTTTCDIWLLAAASSL